MQAEAVQAAVLIEDTRWLLLHLSCMPCPTALLRRCCPEEQCLRCRFLDGRVWPQEDEKQVKLMMAMIHHCTGRACF